MPSALSNDVVRVTDIESAMGNLEHLCTEARTLQLELGGRIEQILKPASPSPAGDRPDTRPPDPPTPLAARIEKALVDLRAATAGLLDIIARVEL